MPVPQAMRRAVLERVRRLNADLEPVEAPEEARRIMRDGLRDLSRIMIVGVVTEVVRRLVVSSLNREELELLC